MTTELQLGILISGAIFYFNALRIRKSSKLSKSSRLILSYNLIVIVAPAFKMNPNKFLITKLVFFHYSSLTPYAFAIQNVHSLSYTKVLGLKVLFFFGFEFYSVYSFLKFVSILLLKDLKLIVYNFLQLTVKYQIIRGIHFPAYWTFSYSLSSTCYSSFNTIETKIVSTFFDCIWICDDFKTYRAL